MSEPRVLFISKLLGWGERGGGEYWINLNLFRELEKLGLDIWLVHHSPMHRYSSRAREIILSSFAMRNDFLLLAYNSMVGPRVLAQVKPNIVHVADESMANCAMVNPVFGGMKKVATITDLIPLTLPQFFAPRFRYTTKIFGIYVARFYDCIVTISKSAANDISKICKAPLHKIEVVYPGINPIFRPLPKELCRNFVAKKYGIKTPYILYVGGTAPNKNVPRLIDAYRILWKKAFKGLSLLLTRLINPVALKGDSELTLPPINRQDLPRICRAAEALVFPSLAEGFGLPPVEAMACGTPVVVSDIPVFHEVLGDAALYANPFDPEEIAAAVESLLRDKGLAHELELKGLERAKRYSWSHAAKRLTEVYYQLLAEP